MMKTTIILLAVTLTAVTAAPAVFSKSNSGWSRVQSAATVQRMLEMAGGDSSVFWEDQFAGESDDEDDEQGKWGRDDKDGSGNDKPNRESEGMCIHRETQHTIQIGSMELNQALCLLCSCLWATGLSCLKIC